MRVTENSIRKTVQDSLQNSRQRMDKIQRQNATLKRINKPSDDAVGNLKLMKLRDEMMNNEQYAKNAALARNFLNYTDSTLSEALDVVNRAKELSVQMASSAAQGPDSRAMVAEEINTLQKQLVSIANKRLGERYLFAGYKTGTQPFDTAGRFSGDRGAMMVEVDKDVFVQMNMNGSEVFLGSGAKAKQQANFTAVGNEGAVNKISVDDLKTTNDSGQSVEQGFVADGDLFRTLDVLHSSLKTNDVEQIQALLEPLDAIRERVISARAEISSRVAGVDATEKANATRAVYDSELMSKIEDTDLIETVSDLAREETVLKASLAASQKLIQPNLLDFLR